MNRNTSIFLIGLVLSLSLGTIAQVPEAREAIDRQEYVRAVNILTAALAANPTSDTYFYLGIAYGNMREWERAESVLREGAERYREARFYNELAGIFLAANDVEKAKGVLQEALGIDPGNDYATDLLATIDMSEGKVQSALRFWNQSGRPILDDILHNSNLTIGHWTVREAIAFRPAGVLRYSQWRTTQLRLYETGIFSNAGIEIEPTPIPSQYNAIVLTSEKTNTPTGFVFNLIKGLPAKTSYVDVWDIGNSGVSFNSSYRWEARRRRGELRLRTPVPLPGILFIDTKAVWRSEYWDVSRVIRGDANSPTEFHYKSTGARIEFKHIPHYRFEIGAGFEYTNRAAAGNLPQVSTDSRNTGKVLLETTIRIADNRYRNRLHVEAFAARKRLGGDLSYTGVTAELNNRVLVSDFRDTNFDWTIKAGTSRGQVPIEDYFVLGIDTHAKNLIRGHQAARRGHYGNAPMGTDFVLVNLDLERRFTAVPLFNTLDIPFLVLKWELFVDGAKTFDRARLFQQGKLLVDAGAGLKIETPTQGVNLVYGRSLRDGTGVFAAYIEKRW